MKTTCLAFTLLLLAGSFARGDEPAASPAARAEVKPLHVLLVGNSQCPTIVKLQLLEKLAASDEGQPQIKVSGCVKGGASLKSHWEAGTEAGTARAMIAQGGWDYVILQDIYYVQKEAFEPYAKKFHKVVQAAGAKTLLFGTASILSDYPQGFERQHELHNAIGKELGVPIVDASYAYKLYFGDMPSQEKLESLFAADRAHPGLWGSYLYSCLLYSAMTTRSPIGLAAPEMIPADAAKTLQEVAWKQHAATLKDLSK